MSLWLSHPLFLPSLVVGITVLLWATSLLPEFITALLFFTVAMAAKIAPPDMIFGGFASSAFWLVFSGFVLGIAIRKTGLADRAARALSAKLTDSWLLMVSSVVLLSYALAFVMPSNMGRIALLMPIVAAMAKRAGIADGTRAWYGLALAVGFGTFQLSATILPANVPNLVMSGAAEGSYGIHLNYVPYLLLHTPILAWLKGAVLIALICWLFPGAPCTPREAEASAPMSRNEKRLAWMLTVVLMMWVTESWHGIGPAWTGLAAAVVTMLPRIGFISGDEFASGINIRACIYVAGILGLALTVTQTGIGNAVGETLLHVMPLDTQKPFTSFLALTGITTALNFIMTANGVPALYTTLAESFAAATGFPLLSVIMIQVLGYSTPILPYQASPIVVAMALGKVPAKAGMLLCLALAAVTYLVLLPLDYAWFRVLGKL
ncbi:SLC13 family permease [Salmonella enterica]|uniref:Citrate transporter n=2 Tax=Salmonella enterica TaxID=28901 RepID=A0A379SBL1_SALER|nr:SLC13 family permease [Salmonella enterica]EAO5938551.1 citrate transporter [Salmonella enterica subsp. houtenae serovar 48:g,z51:-]EAW3053713.1 citrate transporter [Salmonella enterica subsp. enterica]EBH8076840.1 citrate transporter [Salmonella bongori]ECP3268036.1 citrate transporter [Salmonella enterica subsp. enterica serovar [1],13,23:g,z51:-]ECU0369469.1 citrate transporter [Salmonella enterica subsp. enterica serovar Newport]ECU8518885.1 citrate transporter [Salmonella enterica sub